MPDVLQKFERIISDNRITRMAEREDIGNIGHFVERVKAANSFIAEGVVLCCVCGWIPERRLKKVMCFFFFSHQSA